MEAAKYVPRHFISIRKLLVKYPTQEAFDRDGAAGLNDFDDVIDLLVSSLRQANCPLYKSPFAERLGQGRGLRDTEIIDWCGGNPAAVSTLVKADVLRRRQPRRH